MTALLPLLQTLASLETTPAERNRASRTLLSLLQQSERRLLRSVSSLTDADREDAIQHVLLKASTGTARCQATSEGEAWAWCIRVACNFGLSVAKAQRRHVVVDELPDRGETGDEEHREVRARVQEMLKRGLTIIRNSARGDEKDASVQCAVEYLFQSKDIKEQIDTFGFPEGRPTQVTTKEYARARNRVYAYRSRGVGYLLAALDELEKQGIPGEELDFLRRLLTQRKRT